MLGIQGREDNYKIVFSGEIYPSFNTVQVQDNLKKNIQYTDAQIITLFSGKPFVIKKDLTQEAAQSYQKKLASLGAKVIITAQSSRTLDASKPVNTRETPTKMSLIAQDVRPATPLHNTHHPDEETHKAKENRNPIINVSYFLPVILILIGIFMLLAYSPIHSAALKNGFVIGLGLVWYGYYKFKAAKGL